MRFFAVTLALATLAGAPHPLAAGQFADRTVQALEALATKGSVRAQMELAQRYETASGVARDARHALSLYCLAARQGDAGGALMAGRMLVHGATGVVREDALGQAWLRRAGALGSDAAARLTGVPAGTPARAPDRCEPPVPVFAALSPPPPQLRAMVQKLAPTYGLDPALVLAVIAVESNFQVGAVSPKNAMGLMQLIPETAVRFGVANPFDPMQNLQGGMRYLRWLLAYFEGDVTLALAGYNAGEKAVVTHRGVPPFQETQWYVQRVHGLYGSQHHTFDRRIVATAGLPRPAREVVAELSGPPAAPVQSKSASMDN
jgi:hypothetical protein